MRRLLFLTICLVVTMPLWADVVPRDEAKAVAMQFLQKDAPRRAKAKGSAAASMSVLMMDLSLSVVMTLPSRSLAIPMVAVSIQIVCPVACVCSSTVMPIK